VLVKLLQGGLRSQAAVHKPLPNLWVRSPATKVNLIATDMNKLIWENIEHLAQDVFNKRQCIGT
jgi:hypothetical protein